MVAAVHPERSGKGRTTSTAARLAVAALEVFEEHGYHDGSVSQIAEIAGVSERTFFRHFKSKEMALFADKGDIVELFNDPVVATMDPFDAAADGLRKVVISRQADQDLWRRRYALIDAEDDLVALDRNLDAGLLELMSAVFSKKFSAKPDVGEIVTCRGLAAMFIVGGASILRAAANGVPVEALIDDLTNRVRAAHMCSASSTPSKQTVVVIVENPTQSSAMIEATVRAALQGMAGR